jgi:predicted metal-dependent hydrolase
MNNMTVSFDLDGIPVSVQRKSVKYLRIKVKPPLGEVKVSAPYWLTDAELMQMLEDRQVWIEQKVAYFASRPKLPVSQLNSGELHYVWGGAVRLVLEPTSQSSYLDGSDNLVLGLKNTKDITHFATKQRILDDFYRQQTKQQLHQLLPEWQQKVGVVVSDCNARKMKTKWGSCNVTAKRIWLSTSLARLPLSCLEYVLVHELVHLHEASHNKRFYQLMQHYLPDWKTREMQLKSSAEQMLRV